MGAGKARGSALAPFTLSLMLGSTLATPAFAQQEADPPPGPVAQSTTEDPQANPDEGQVIVVTAQKREQSLQDVPVSVLVVGGDRLESLKLNRATDLQYVVPGISSPEQTGPRNFGFFIRGIGTNTFSAETIEPSTAYFVDGVVMGQAGATLTDLPDIERIEVLRGPQSTLFGKNSSAGVINVITRAPSKQLEVKAGISFAKPNEDLHYYGYVSGPISEELGFSVSGRRSKREGYIRNLVDDRRFNDRDEFGFRGKLRWQPSSALSATLIGDYWESDTNCCIWTVQRFGPRTPPGAPLFFENPSLALIGEMNPGRSNQRQTIDGDVFARIKNYGASLQFDYDLGGGHELTSISAWRGFKTVDGLDSDSSPLNYLNVNFADLTQNQISQELRIASPTGGFVDYVAGLYYFRQRVKDRVLQLFPFLPGTLFPPFLIYLNKEQFNRVTTTNVAAFGQVNFHPTEKLVLTVGARLLNEKQRVHKDITDPTTGNRAVSDGRNKDTFVTFRAAAEYHFHRDLMAYAAVVRGYKGGGFDLYGSRPGLVFVGPEKPTSYELGLRTSFPNAGLTFNITGYHSKIDGYQTSSRDPQTLLFPIRNNDAKTKGFEAEMVWRPVGQKNFSLNLGLAYTDAEWGSFPDAPCAGGQKPAEGCVGGVQNLTGEPLPFAPKWAFNIGPDFESQLSSNLKLSATANLNYRSSHVIGFPNSPDAQEKGYALLGGSVALGAVDDRWKVSVFGKNLTDEHFRTFQFNLSSGSSYMYRVYESRRIVGVALDVAF